MCNPMIVWRRAGERKNAYSPNRTRIPEIWQDICLPCLAVWGSKFSSLSVGIKVRQIMIVIIRVIRFCILPISEGNLLLLPPLTRRFSSTILFPSNVSSSLFLIPFSPVCSNVRKSPFVMQISVTKLNWVTVPPPMRFTPVKCIPETTTRRLG